MGYSPFRHIGSVFRKKSPIHLTFFVTGRCNARCPFCFYLPGNGYGPKAPELSLDEIERISSSMGSLLWFALSGGEIFLREDLAAIVKTFYRNNRPSIILMPTNGLLPERVLNTTEEVLRACPKSTVVVKLSLDGPAELHDSLRGVSGAFRKVMETYHLLAPLMKRYDNFELGINTLFCSTNQDHMEEIAGLVNDLETVRTHTVSCIRGKVEDEGLKDFDISKYLAVIEKMESCLHDGKAATYRFRGARLKAAQDILQRRYIYRTLLEQRPLLPCYAGRLNIVLTEEGDVYPCESFTRKMGNVRDMECDMKRLLGSDTARRAVRSIREERCWCTHECYMMTNILFNPMKLPALMIEYARLGSAG